MVVQIEQDFCPIKKDSIMIAIILGGKDKTTAGDVCRSVSALPFEMSAQEKVTGLQFQRQPVIPAKLSPSIAEIIIVPEFALGGAQVALIVITLHFGV